MRTPGLVFSILLATSVPLPIHSETTVEEYRRAVAQVDELQRKYADDEATILAPISDRSGDAVLVFGSVVCRNFQSPHCPPPTQSHNLMVLNPYPDDIESNAVLRGRYYYLRRTTSKNSLGADVPLLVYGIPSDLRKARERVVALERAAREKGLDAATGESLERLQARKDEAARRAAEARKAAELENARKQDDWAAEREQLRPGSTESKMSLIFLVEEFPEGCLLNVSLAGHRGEEAVLVRKDLPPELFGYCNYQKRVPIQEPVDLCRYFNEKRHKRGERGAFIATGLATYPCYGEKRCLLSLVTDSIGAFPCPKKESPTPVPNPFKQ